MKNNCYDYGCKPLAINIAKDTYINNNFRTSGWTGDNLQLTSMCIPVCSEIGLEMHSDTDQFLYIVCGKGFVMMGKEKDCLDYKSYVSNQWGIFIPAGTWHNLKNIGEKPLKLFSVYAPPQHPLGTVHRTKADSDMAEH